MSEGSVPGQGMAAYGFSTRARSASPLLFAVAWLDGAAAPQDQRQAG